MDSEQGKWYFKNSVVVVALLSVGPLALPLVLFNPRYSKKTKVIITLAVIVLTYLTMVVMKRSLYWIKEYYKQIGLIQQ